MTDEEHSTEKKKYSLIIAWWFYTFLREAFYSPISVALSMQKLFFLYPRKMRSLVPQDGVAGTEGVSWNSSCPLWVRGEVVSSLSGIAILSIMSSCLHIPHKTTSTKKWTILPEGSKDGTQLEIEEHISLHVHFLFQLPVRIQQRLGRCVFLLSWIKQLWSLDTAMTFWCHLSNTVHWMNEDNLPLPLSHILD